MPGKDPKRANLRQAYSCANDVYEELKRQPVPTYEDQLCMDLASMIVEGIACYNNNQRINSKNFMQIMRQQHYGKQPHLYKLGFALSVLLNALLIERFPLPSTSSRHVNKATTSYADAPEPQRPPFRSPSKPAEDIKQEPVEEDGEAIIAEAERLLFGTPETTNEVKKEPVEVKEEPADDGYEPVKEEPLVDVFCPATGSSRPLDSTDHVNDDDESADEAGMPWTARKSGLAPQPKTAVKRKATDSREPTKLNKRAGPSNFVGKGRACYLCATITEDYETTPPLSNQAARLEFLDRIIKGSQIARDRVEKLRSMRVTAFFCAKHIAPPKKTPTINATIKKSACDICDEPEPPISIAPSNPFTRRRFFNTMLPLTAVEQNKVDSMINNNDAKMSFCARHFKYCDKPKLDDLDKKGERFVSAINARKNSALRRNMPPSTPQSAIRIAFPRVSPIRIDVGYPGEDPVTEEPEVKEEPQ